MKVPETIQDIEKLIDGEVPESLHLEYKSSPALSRKKKDEVCKDVSSFANADGGLLIYGVRERGHIPHEIDQGVDDSEIDREWIDQILSFNITPPIEGLEIVQIGLNETHSLYSLGIPKSFRGPHQAPDKKYYKRYNFRSAPMDHYEIEDIRNRKFDLPPLVHVDIELHGFIFKLLVENIGTQVANDVTFQFSEAFKWPKDPLPAALNKGIRYFPPGRKFRYTYASSIEALKEGSGIPKVFDISASYIHPQSNRRVSETFHFDLNDYYGASIEKDALKDIAKSLETLSEIKSVIQEHNRYMKELECIAAPTGLDLSVRSLRNLRHLLAKDEHFEPIDIKECEFNVIKEVIGVDIQMAFRIYDYFHHDRENKDLKDIEGMTDEIIEKINRYFKI